MDNSILSLLYNATQGSLAANHVWSKGEDGTLHVNKTYTYQDLLIQAHQVADALTARCSFTAGQPVFIACHGPWDALSAWWACQLLELVPCLLPRPHADAKRQAAILCHLRGVLRSDICIVSTQQKDDLEGFAQMFEVAAVSSLKPDRSPPSSSCKFVSEDTVAALMLTSGSTAMPKAVALTHHNLIAAARAKAAHLGHSPSSILFNWIGVDHVACLTEVHLTAMAQGAEQHHCLPEDVVSSPTCFLDLLEIVRASYSFAPNFLLSLLLKEKLEKRDLSHLRVLCSGGEAVPTRTAIDFAAYLERCGARTGALTAGFGMTETCAGCIYDNAPTSVAELQTCEHPTLSVGTPVPLTRARIVEGELQLKGENVTPGYYNDAAATELAFTADGWFRTGDLAAKDNAGRINLIGRQKDVINLNGVSISCASVEDAISNADIPNVTSTYTVASSIMTSLARESYLVAFKPQDSSPTSPATLAAIAAIKRCASLATGQLPIAVLPLGEADLSKSTLGKISRSSLSKKFQAGAFTDLQVTVDHAHTKTKQSAANPAGASLDNHRLATLEADLLDDLAEVLKVEGPERHHIHARAEFTELGISSISLTRLKVKFVERCRLEVPKFELPAVELLRLSNVRTFILECFCKQMETESQVHGETVYKPIVTLQKKGSATPLFLIHPGVGECFVFLRMARLISDRPIYAFRARGLSDESPESDVHTPTGCFRNMDQMIACYVEAILEKQSDGPFAILGYSYGGVVAFEIAKQLEQRGKEIGFLGMMNIPPHISWRMQQLDWTEIAINLSLFLSLYDDDLFATVADRLRANSEALTREAKADLLLTSASPERRQELDLDSVSLKRWIDVAFDLGKMGVSYTPTGRLRRTRVAAVFVAVPLAELHLDVDTWQEKHLEPWSEFIPPEQADDTSTPLRFVRVQGSHYTMLNEENVDSFVCLLQEQLQQAGV